MQLSPKIMRTPMHALRGSLAQNHLHPPPPSVLQPPVFPSWVTLPCRNAKGKLLGRSQGNLSIIESAMSLIPKAKGRRRLAPSQRNLPQLQQQLRRRQRRPVYPYVLWSLDPREATSPKQRYKSPLPNRSNVQLSRSLWSRYPSNNRLVDPFGSRLLPGL